MAFDNRVEEGVVRVGEHRNRRHFTQSLQHAQRLREDRTRAQVLEEVRDCCVRIPRGAECGKGAHEGVVPHLLIRLERTPGSHRLNVDSLSTEVQLRYCPRVIEIVWVCRQALVTGKCARNSPAKGLSCSKTTCRRHRTPLPGLPYLLPTECGLKLLYPGRRDSGSTAVGARRHTKQGTRGQWKGATATSGAGAPRVAVLCPESGLLLHGLYVGDVGVGAGDVAGKYPVSHYIRVNGSLCGQPE